MALVDQRSANGFILALMGLIVGFNISGEPLIMLEAIMVCIIAPVRPLRPS